MRLVQKIEPQGESEKNRRENRRGKIGGGDGDDAAALVLFGEGDEFAEEEYGDGGLSERDRKCLHRRLAKIVAGVASRGLGGMPEKQQKARNIAPFRST